MAKIKHFQGYGTVQAVKIKDKSCTLHVKVIGNHECGLRRDDDYDLYNWLVKRFDKSFETYMDFREKRPQIEIEESIVNGVDVCDYRFTY